MVTRPVTKKYERKEKQENNWDLLSLQYIKKRWRHCMVSHTIENPLHQFDIQNRDDLFINLLFFVQLILTERKESRPLEIFMTLS